MLSTKQITTINDALIKKGISYKPLLVDLIDHLSCSIEQKMEGGSTFNQALHQSISEFGDLGLERTQEATLYFLTIKLKIMRNIASSFGIIGSVLTITGALLKAVQLPPAGILFFSGTCLLALFFLPLLLIIKLKETQGPSGKFNAFSGTLSAIVILIGILFKLMHWPASNIILASGIALFCILFIPSYFIKSYQQAENKLFSISLVMCILATVAISASMIWRKNSHNVDSALASRLTLTQNKNESLLKEIPENTNNPKTAYLEILITLDNLKTQLINGSGFDGNANHINFTEVNWKHSTSNLNKILEEFIPSLEQSLNSVKNKTAHTLLQKELNATRLKEIKNLPLYESIMELEQIKSAILFTALLTEHNDLTSL